MSYIRFGLRFDTESETTTTRWCGSGKRYEADEGWDALLLPRGSTKPRPWFLVLDGQAKDWPSRTKMKLKRKQTRLRQVH